MFQKAKNVYHYFFALGSSIFFGFPSKNLVVVGVTGTDGKTTTTSMIYEILKAAGKKVSMVSSIGANISTEVIETGFHVSTPNPWQVQKLLRKAADVGSTHFVIEATSHGLDQNRLAFIDFELGVLTNISPEHLDYHGNFKNYIGAKAKLLINSKVSVLNLDDPSFEVLRKKNLGKIVTYSVKNKKANVNLKKIPIDLKIAGVYNIYNALAAAGATLELKVSKQTVLKALNEYTLPEGRLQKISAGQKFKAIVDFAHTGNALKNALEALKQDLTPDGRLIAMFGAAGERYKAKRQELGEEAAKGADITIITSEDPRREDPTLIASQIAAGLKKYSKKLGRDYYVETDRKKAIQKAISLAKAQDTVVFFGKGHEKSMNINGREMPWDEAKEVEMAIKGNEK